MVEHVAPLSPSEEPALKKTIVGKSFPNNEFNNINSNVLKIKKLNPDAKVPKRGSERAASYDISSVEEAEIPPKGKYLFSTGLSMAIPTGHYGRVAPRSGLAVKHFIDVGAGVIDEDYRGELKVLLFNFGEEAYKVSKGDRIAQLILEKISTPEVVEVESLDETERGQGGFGSTGKN
jgi:dUTP pyrophosphatase